MSENEMLSGVNITENSCGIDMETGEYFGEEYSVGDVSFRGRAPSPPIDISSIRSREVFNEMIGGKIGKRKYRLWVSPLLLEMVIDKDIYISSLSVFCYLGQNIGYSNMVYIKTKDIVDQCSYTRQTVSLAIEDLKVRGLIKEVVQKLEGRDDRLFLIYPLYFFLGYFPMRDVLLRDWSK